MADISLLLEAEKRGILPDDKKALLDEARKRGLVPGPQTQLTQALKEQPSYLQKAAPYIMGVARPVMEIGGAVGGAALVGGASAPTVAGVIPGAAVGGALGYAAGKSGADLLARSIGQMPPIKSMGEAAKETVGNLESGVGMEVGGAVIGKAVKLAKPVGKGLISVLFGPPLSSIDARFINNAAIKAAKPFEVLARELPSDLQAVASHVEELSNKALKTLSTSKYIMQTAEDTGGAKTKDVFINAIKSEMKDIGLTMSESSASAKNKLLGYIKRFNKLGPTVSENQMGKIVRQIDQDIDWSLKDQAPLNSALEGIRTKIDGVLKLGNPEYAKAMEPVSDGVRTLKKAETLFRVERDIGRGYKPTNTTATALKSAVNENRIESQDVLDSIHKITGKDYLSAAENAKIAENFVGGRPQGSRGVNLGAAVGSGVGALAGGLHGGTGPGMTGAILGAMGGGYMDRQGGQMAGSLIDRLAQASKYITPFPWGQINRGAAAAALQLRRQNQSETP